MAVANQPIELVLKNTIERIDILVTDVNGVPIDATQLTLSVYNSGEQQIIADDFNLGYGIPPSLPTRIVKPVSTTGQYYFPFGDTSFDPNNNTSNPGEYLFSWHIVGAIGTEAVNVVQVANVVSVRTMRWVPKLRLIVDKAAKLIDDDPDDPVFLGYTDSMLVQYLEDGLSLINSAQPYPMWTTIDQFPQEQYRTLLDGATMCALTSQEIFAIDTDVSYSDNGNVFLIDHQPKLATALNTIWMRFKETVPGMKRHYLNNGTVRVEFNASARFQQLLDSAPAGALFRNTFVAGLL